MKAKPILFSTPMVQAILNGRKTQTRRVQGLEKFNENPHCFRYDGTSNYEDQPQFYEHYFEAVDIHGKPTEKYTQVKAKVKPGDILWVRETFYKTISPELKGAYYYKASIDDGYNFRWKPSIHMPKKAARIFLKVTNVRVERLQDITAMDAINEGIQKTWISDDEKSTMWKNYINNGKGSYYHPVKSFSSLWESINGKESWDRNPWVWVYDFEFTQKPSNWPK